MASSPPHVSSHPAVSIQPVVPPANLVPAAIAARRATLPPQTNPDLAPPAPQLAPPVQPALEATPPATPDPVGTHALLNDPALAAFLAQPPAQPVAPAAPPAQPTVDGAMDPAPQPVQPPAQHLSFSELFDAPPPAAVTPESGTAAELAELRNQIATMTTMLQNRPAVTSAPATVDVALTDEERHTYGQSLPIIQRVVEAHTNAARAELTALIESVRAEVNDALGGVQTGVGEFRRNSYTQQLRVSVPDIDQLTNHPSFQSFLAQPVPYSGGATIKQRLADGHRASDLAKVVEIMNDFRRAVAGSADVPVVPPMSAMAQPSTSAAPAPAAPTAAGPQTMLPWSKRQLAYREYRAGRMSSQDFDKIDAAYRVADANKLVDFNA